MSPGVIGVPLSGKVVPRVEPAPDALGDASPPASRARSGASGSSTGFHRSRSSPVLGLHRGPDLDPPDLLAVRIVPDRIARTTSVRRAPRPSANTASTKSSTLFGAPPRHRRAQIGERRAQPSSARLLNSARWLPERVGIGALEAEDRLLLVADREQRARTHPLARALAGKELLRQLVDDAPLLRAGVLRFVDQDVVEPAVELVEHPGRGMALFQQRNGARGSDRRNRAPRARASSAR